MDDWNDFGSDPAGPPPAARPAANPQNASRSTIHSVSSSSVARYDDDDDTNNIDMDRPRDSRQGPAAAADSQHAPPTPDSFAHARTAPPGSPPDAPERSSFLSSFPFLSARRRSSRPPEQDSSNEQDAQDALTSPEAQRSTAIAAADSSFVLADEYKPSAPTPPRSPRSGLIMHPVDQPRMADRTAEDIGDGMSAASESDAGEPQSVMMSRRRTTGDHTLDEADSIDKDHASLPQPRRGALDDAPDDHEFNIEGFRFISSSQPPSFEAVDEPQSSVIASSLLRHPDKSYTKLEVISARQIRALIIFFNLFVLLSVCLTVVMVVKANTSMKVNQEIVLPNDLLTEEQKKRSSETLVMIPGAPIPLPVIGRSLGYPAEQKRSERVMIPYRIPTLSRTARFRSSLNGDPLHSAQTRVILKCSLEASGLYPNQEAVVRGPSIPLNTCLSQNLPLETSRQGFSFPPGTSGTSAPGASTASGTTPDTSTGSGTTPDSTATNPTGSSPEAPGAGGAAGDLPPGLPPGLLPGFPVPQGPRQPGSNTYPEGSVLYRVLPVNIVVWDPDYQKGGSYLTLALSILFLIIAVLFGIRLLRAKRRNMTHEQIWVLILTIVTALYYNPVAAALTIAKLDIKAKDVTRELPSWTNCFQEAFSLVRDIAFAGVCYFYLWANLHSFRILDPTKRLGFRAFYLPKLLVLIPYSIFHILSFTLADLWLTEVPLLSGLTFAFTFGSFRVRNYLWTEMWLSVFKSIMDIALVALIITEALRTMRALERAPYMKHRAKRVGFRFFLFINFSFYALFILEHALLMYVFPRGNLLVHLLLTAKFLRVDSLWYVTTGPAILLAGYVLCTAYVHLPYTSVGWLKGWFMSSSLGESSMRWSFSSNSRSEVPSSIAGGDSEDNGKGGWGNDEETPVSLVDNDSELQQQIVEPITYRKRESKDSLELKANCFTMQTHIIMFNFAWYVYYYGTPKLDNFRPKENPLPFEFKVDTHIKSMATDTQALILDCTDRIIVTFKGTTSMKNLKTSLRMNHSRLASVVRYNADGGDEFARLKKLFGQRYIWAKIHKGFATAYLDVAQEVTARVRALRAMKKRPVFLTGHSLGGALATVCSLDLWVKLNVSRREIFVSTFGSPRVGNMHFAALHKEVVPLHWRIVVDPDMVAKLPRGGYAHVGKKVVLTPHGEMIIDPNALEQRPWTGEAAGFAYHRKASYMLAMRAWCVRNHGMTYTPVFWPFPVRPEDERRFAGAFEEGDVYQGGSKFPVKIIQMDAMVDALGDGAELDNMAVVEKWGRLTRRVLLNDKLASNQFAGLKKKALKGATPSVAKIDPLGDE